VGKIVFCVTAVALLAIGACQQRGEALPPGRATVIDVVDGDTIHARVGGRRESVRLIGIDTPETHGRGGLRECFGEEASKRLENLLPEGATLTVVRDVEPRDRYGRLLAYVYRASDGQFVNLAMARDGYAVPLTIPPNVAHTAELVAAAGDARRADRGLWAKCGGADTPIP
jgi:micrococcal nuclease